MTSSSSSSIDVLIVGAGPTGLMLGCELSLYPNISFRIIDKNLDSTTQSRALVIHARSLEIFAQLNLIDKFMSQGRFMDKICLYVRGQEALQFDLIKIRSEQTLVTQYPYLLILEQSVTEHILEAFLHEHNVKVERQIEAIDFSEEGSSENALIQVTLSSGEVIRTKYVCGCDGARSAVRHKLNLPFAGRTFSQSLFVADYDVDNAPTQRNEAGIFFSSTGLAAIFPFANNRYRLLGTIADTDNDETNLTIEEVANIFKSRTHGSKMKIYNNHWMSIYRSHHRHVTLFRSQKRYFLLGDAAHIHSPVGGQGMNTGLQDAHNLAWKLVHVLTNNANDRLLDTYHDERSPVAKKLVHTVDRAFAFLSNTHRIVQLLRLYLMPLIFRFVVQPLFNHSRTIRQKAYRQVSQLGITYRSSNPYNAMASIGDFATTTPVPGDRFPYVIFETCYYHLVIFQNPQQDNVKYFVESIKKDYFKLIKIHNVREENIPLYYEGAFLIRPDGYIAYRTTLFDIKHFQSYFQQIYS